MPEVVVVTVGPQQHTLKQIRILQNLAFGIDLPSNCIWLIKEKRSLSN
jgi:hypothetical protein